MLLLFSALAMSPRQRIRLAEVATAIEAMIRKDAVRKRSQIGNPTCRRTALAPVAVADPTALKPSVVFALTFSKLEVIAEPALWMTVGSSAVASAASRP